MKPKGIKFSAGSRIMFIGSAVTAVIALALLVLNIYLFQSIVSQYLAQGYPAAEVYRQLITNQLLPGIFEPLGLYGGISLLLYSAGIINNKLSPAPNPVEEAFDNEGSPEKYNGDLSDNSKDNYDESFNEAGISEAGQVPETPSVLEDNTPAEEKENNL